MFGGMLVACVVVCFGVLGARGEMKARCDITTEHGTGVISGQVELVQMEGNNLKVTGNINNIQKGKHGFHVHQEGDLGNACKNAKGHYNPDNKNHGAPDKPRTERHAGDFGNIEAMDNKIATIDMTMQDTNLNNIINRSIVVHAGEDDLGLGGKDDSLTTGAAGARLGCCIIHQVNAGAGVRELASTLMLITGIIALLL